MRLAWLTDIHLNFVDAVNRRHFLETIESQADSFAISGDIAESPSIIGVLTEMKEILQKPIYFVLGNHDFYRGSIEKTRGEVAKLAEQCELLTYLTATGVVELSRQTALVGHDGWADAPASARGELLQKSAVSRQHPGSPKVPRAKLLPR
jgi:predicted MPP superfamily phosphohydrolase